MKMDVSKFKGMEYVTAYPEGYRAEKKYPVIIFLHGAGSRGNDITIVKRNALFEAAKQYEPFPFVMVAPQCSENTWFDMFERLKELVIKVSEAPFTDKQRIYLTGNSMGGYATWQLAMSMPEYFAAIVPLCGGGMYWNAWRLANVPVWAFHGEKDDVVFAEESKKMVDAVNASGGNAKLTLYPEHGHDVWTDTYSNYAVFEWLLSHRNGNAQAIEEQYNDATKYG